MHIALIGMPGVGKSTVGRRLADVLRYRFVDPDKVMEEAHGIALQNILEKLGAVEFLKAEAKTVIACAGIVESSVIAPGGSIVYSEVAMRALKATSIIIFLDAPLSTIVSRIGTAQRGIVGNMSLAEIYAERVPLYQAWAMSTVEAHRGLDVIVNDILKLRTESGIELPGIF
jgi:shikimate kinase